MKTQKRENYILAIADKHRAFKDTVNHEIERINEAGEKVKEILTEYRYRQSVSVQTEEEAAALVEVPYWKGVEATEAGHALNLAREELSQIEVWFASTDYIPNKVIVGEWSEDDERFVKYKAERAKKRARRDELEAFIHNA